MPTDGFGPVLRMVEAFGLVAGVAVPVGLLAWWFGRRASAVSLPVPSLDDPVYALVYLGVFVGNQLVTAVLGDVGVPRKPGQDIVPQAATWRAVVGSLLATPLVAGGWLWFQPSRAWGAACRAVGVGVATWLLVSPVVYAVHAGAEWASAFAGIVPEEHPLVKLLKTADLGQAAVLCVAVAVATPFAEEVIFRGLLLGWLIRRPGWDVMPVAVAALLTLGSTTGTVRLLAGGQLVVLAVVLLAVRRWPEVAAVWSTATLFALVHAGVWPTPVPLFLLGLALGAVAVRTGGVLAGTVLHGLFNAMSLVCLLRP